MIIESIGIGNITTLATFNMSTAPHALKRCRKAGNKKVRSGRCFATHLLFFPSSRRVGGGLRLRLQIALTKYIND